MEKKAREEELDKVVKKTNFNLNNRSWFIFAALVLSLLFLLIGYAQLFPGVKTWAPEKKRLAKNKVEVRSLTLSEFKNFFDHYNRTENDNFIILDLRSREKWQQGFIPRSIVWSPKDDYQIQRLARYNSILIVAEESNTAKAMAQQLAAKKWSHSLAIYWLRDSVQDWFARSYPLARLELD